MSNTGKLFTWVWPTEIRLFALVALGFEPHLARAIFASMNFFQSGIVKFLSLNL